MDSGEADNHLREKYLTPYEELILEAAWHFESESFDVPPTRFPAAAEELGVTHLPSEILERFGFDVLVLPGVSGRIATMLSDMKRYLEQGDMWPRSREAYEFWRTGQQGNLMLRIKNAGDRANRLRVIKAECARLARLFSQAARTRLPRTLPLDALRSLILFDRFRDAGMTAEEALEKVSKAFGRKATTVRGEIDRARRRVGKLTYRHRERSRRI